uniref:PRONE domain-containing protein n=1 Tax=Kalanchoe fedtschenkoi TaxID=63787 RepID=A0A7N0VKZ1_KALFE
MKEKFAKLLLGEDMSGGGKGVSSALALSNAITNLAASVFGEQRKLEPMPTDTKLRWRKEIDWLLSVTNHIVEFAPSQQKSQDGTTMEIMTTRQRNDLRMNIPALRKLDAMLIESLDNFEGPNEFWYVSKNEKDSNNETSQRHEDKWWLPTPKVPANGLSDAARRWLQFQKDSVNQVLKAAMAINAQVLSEMEIPDNYTESLPKNGRCSLGDSIYKSITVEFFDPEQFLSTMDLSTEHKVLDLKNRMEASIVIWTRKMTNKDGKSHWGGMGSTVSLEKRELFEERAETILLVLKQQFPGLPQSSLDISKIQYNKDVGHAILESYSRVMESLAFTVLSRIEDVLYADSVTQDPSLAETKSKQSSKVSSPLCEDDASNSAETPNAFTLSDSMGWTMAPAETTTLKKSESTNNLAVATPKGGDNEKIMTKFANIVTQKKLSYLEKIENLSGLRSPTGRH